jgi:hypothetical protein
MPKSVPIRCRSTTTLALNADSVSLHVPLEPSAPTASLTSPRAIRTTIASSWVDSTTGWKQLRRAGVPLSTARKYQARRLCLCGKAFRLARTIRRPTASPSALPGRKSSHRLTSRKQFLEDVVKPLQNKRQKLNVKAHIPLQILDHQQASLGSIVLSDRPHPPKLQHGLVWCLNG